MAKDIKQEVNNMLLAKELGTDLYERLLESKLNEVLTEEGLQIVAAVTTQILVEMAQEDE